MALFTAKTPPQLPAMPNTYDRRAVEIALNILLTYLTQISTEQQLNVTTLNIGVTTLPTEADLANLRSGDIYRDTADNVIKVAGPPVPPPAPGSGDVVGPASAVNDRVVFFDGVTGKLIKDSGLTLSGSNTGDQFTATAVSALLGRGSAGGVGAAEEITLGTNLTMVGTTLNATGGGGSGDVVGPAGAVDNRVVFFDGVTGKLIKDSGLTLSGTNTGDQTLAGLGGQPLDADLTTIAGLAVVNDNFMQVKAGAWSGRTIAQVKTDLSLTGTNSGDQTTIVGITGTKAQFDAACTDGNFLYVGDVTQYTDEMAQDATGAMVGVSLVYNDAGATLQRAALTGHVTAAQDSNALVLGSFTKAQLDAAVSDGNVLYVGDVTQYTDEQAQDAVGAMVDATLVYVDATPVLKRAPITGHITIADGSNAAALGSFTSAQLDTAISDTNGVYQNQLAAGIATFLATPSSANLLAAVTDETGTGGSLVFATGPTISTPKFASPATTSGTVFRFQATPISKAAAATLTNSELLNGRIQYTGAAANLTLPTGTLMDTGASALATLYVGMAFDFSINNTSANTVTLVAGATFTIVGTATTLTGIVSNWTCYRTAVNTWVAFRS